MHGHYYKSLHDQNRIGIENSMLRLRKAFENRLDRDDPKIMAKLAICDGKQKRALLPDRGHIYYFEITPVQRLCAIEWL